MSQLKKNDFRKLKLTFGCNFQNSQKDSISFLLRL